VWRLLYPRAERLGFLKQKGKKKKRAQPKTRIGSVPCPVASSPDPYVRLKFEKPALDLLAIRHSVRSHHVNVSNITLAYWRSERIGGTVAAFAWRAERGTPMPRCGTTTLFRAKSAKRNQTDPTISEKA